MAWLRATVSRFSEGSAHARRRALVEALLDTLDPDALRASVGSHHHGLCNSTLAYLPVVVLASELGFARDDVVADVRVVAAAYHPGTDAPGADEALARLLSALPAVEPEAAAARVALLVQACEATAALVRGALERELDDVLRDTPPVTATKRVAPDGSVVAVPLHGRPFGEGRRRCPGEAHARALVAGVVEFARDQARPIAGTPGAPPAGGVHGAARAAAGATGPVPAAGVVERSR
jgi:hypothetical protein